MKEKPLLARRETPEEINARIYQERAAAANGKANGAGPPDPNVRLAIRSMMDRGLMDGEIREEIGQRLSVDDLGQVIAKERKHWEGEQRRARAHAKTIDHEPATNLPTDGAELLDEVSTWLRRFVQYPNEHASSAHTLWVVHTHAMEAWESTPRLAFLSPEPASGKTRALEATEPLVPNPIEAVNVSAAYLFRKVGDEENGPPTILFDEVDTVFGPKAQAHEELRGLLNAGHRKGAHAGRCVVVGKTVKTEEIPAYAAVALAGLGALPDTIMSRSIVVRMQRRTQNEKIEPWRRRKHEKEGKRLAKKIGRWSQAKIGDTIDRWPEMPDGVNDRDADMWEPLIAIADEAGGHWPETAREAAQAIVSASKVDNGSLGVRLLSDIRDIMGDRYQMTTADLLAALCAKEDAPWGDLRGKPISSQQLSRLLRPYGIKPTQIRIGDKTPRGYIRGDFRDAWERYLPSIGENDKTPKTGTTGGDEPPF